MLSKDMTFPATFDLTGPYTSIKGVVTGVLLSTYGSRHTLFYGYTSINSRDTDRLPAIWNIAGKCLQNGSNSKTADQASLKFAPSPAQLQYEKLSVDQRAILCALVTRGHYSDNARNYLKESLKVDRNLDAIIAYAIKKDFK